MERKSKNRKGQVLISKESKCLGLFMPAHPTVTIPMCFHLIKKSNLLLFFKLITFYIYIYIFFPRLLVFLLPRGTSQCLVLWVSLPKWTTVRSTTPTSKSYPLSKEALRSWLRPWSSLGGDTWL